MKYIRKYNEKLISIYDKEWEKYLPTNLTVLKEQDSKIKKFIFKKGNIMIHSDMLQITYEQNLWGEPDTLEIDIYFLENGELKLLVDITLGDYMISEFSICKSKGVSIIQQTSYGSKFDPSNTLLAFDDNSLEGIIKFFNMFNDGINVKLNDFNFLRNI